PSRQYNQWTNGFDFKLSGEERLLRIPFDKFLRTGHGYVFEIQYARIQSVFQNCPRVVVMMVASYITLLK
ncbi:hypothetical protein BGZ58_002073, partial [Dissophora ornata]